MDPANRSVNVGIDGNDITTVALTQTEFDLLYLLLSTPNQLVSKSEISLKVLGKSLSQWDRSIDVHVSNLRKKLGPYSDGTQRIKTLRGSGYLYQAGQETK
jgi:two-component system response regulator CpxR